MCAAALPRRSAAPLASPVLMVRRYAPCRHPDALADGGPRALLCASFLRLRARQPAPGLVVPVAAAAGSMCLCLLPVRVRSQQPCPTYVCSRCESGRSGRMCVGRPPGGRPAMYVCCRPVAGSGMLYIGAPPGKGGGQRAHIERERERGLFCPRPPPVFHKHYPPSTVSLACLAFTLPDYPLQSEHRPSPLS